MPEPLFAPIDAHFGVVLLLIGLVLVTLVLPVEPRREPPKHPGADDQSKTRRLP